MPDPHAITTKEQLRELIPEATPKLAAKVVGHLGAIERAFIESSPMLFLSTSAADGATTVSPKGDRPGFVQIVDDHTLVIPDRPGNGLAYGLLNILDNPKVGLLFVRPASRETFRVDGRAELTRDPELLKRHAARGKEPVVAIRIAIDRCLFHCAKAFIRSHLWEPKHWPDPYKLSWSAWAKQWYELPDEASAAVDEEVAQDERDNL